MKDSRRPVQARTKAAANPLRVVLLAGIIVTAVLVLLAGSARAQFPRVGLSAAPDYYDGHLDVVADENFTLYVCVFGVDDETPLEQDFAVVSWVLHQVCCGAALNVLDYEFGPHFQTSGNPYFGVIGSAEICVDQPYITLATLTCQLDAPEDGDYLTACGPYQQAVDCSGENPVVMGMPMELTITGVGVSPTERDTWDNIKASFR